MAFPGIASSKASRQTVPEYAPIQAILVSEELFLYDYHGAELATAITDAGAELWVATATSTKPHVVKALLHKSGVSSVALSHMGSLTLPHDNIWLRDFGPIAVQDMEPAGPVLKLIDLRYDDALPLSDKLPKELGRQLKIPVESLNIFVDGGNFLVAKDLCITSGPVEGSGTKELEPGTAALKSDHAATLGCREVLVLKNPPHAHIDMWAKVVDDRRILVNELTEKTLSVARTTGLLPQAQLIKESLDRMAAELGKHLDVIRVPMPLPYRGVFRTYTNSILVNGRAIIPSFKRFGWNYDDYPDVALTAYYETAVVKAYESVGLKPQLINADGMIFNGGAFHCVTVSLPKPFSYQSPLKGI